MSAWRRVSVPIFALISSCGDASEVPTDTPAVASPTHDFVVFDTPAGTLVYDAARGGAVLARSHGEARAASMAPDGRTFAAIGAETITIVDIATGAGTVIALQTLGGPPELAWDDGTVAWADDTIGAHLFDRRTQRHVAVALAGAHLFARAGRFVIWNDHAVQVWRRGASEPETRTASAHVGNVIADETAARVAWLEHDAEADHDRVWLHTLDVARNVHLRFPSEAAPCSIDIERLVRIDGTELVTDEECTTGCPSFPSEPSFVAYDFASGAFTRRWAGPVSPPYNDGLAASARGLRIASAQDGATVVDLESAEGFTPAEVTFADDGARLVGEGRSGVALWDATTGARLFHADVQTVTGTR